MKKALPFRGEEKGRDTQNNYQAPTSAENTLRHAVTTTGRYLGGRSPRTAAPITSSAPGEAVCSNEACMFWDFDYPLLCRSRFSFRRTTFVGRGTLRVDQLECGDLYLVKSVRDSHCLVSGGEVDLFVSVLVWCLEAMRCIPQGKEKGKLR